MSLRHVALDANLLVLLIVGRIHPGLIATHKRLRAFDAENYAMLIAHLDGTTLVTTPNAMTEASNLVAQGVREPARSPLFAELKIFSETVSEAYVPSTSATSMPEYLWLGLTDAAWLARLDSGTELLTVDLNLVLAAQRRGRSAVNFNHRRDQ